ncbi:hypothetical protein M3Y97_00824700 [Aphelenchoides bicaudatus]|nr:hypothetical protein M3Y97_00824700 [Aphelenchoides bicaudatus]
MSKTSTKNPQWNKQFIGQLDEGQFEIVHPFQMRERNKERISIDTHNYFLNASIHYKHIVIVIKTNVVLASSRTRLKLLLNLNEHLFYNATQFEKLSKDGEEFLSYRVENCYYQGTVNGDPTSFVAISTCNGLRGIIAFENGTALGIWPLDGGDKGRKHPHVLYKTRWSKDASCGAVTQTPPQYSPLIKMPSKRDVTRQMKYVELALIGDYQFIKEFNLTEDEAVEMMLEAVNIANAMLAPDLNVRLSVVYSEIWLDAQRVDLHSDIERTLSGSQEYVAGHIYQVEKDATIMFTGGYFANNEMLTGAFSSVCTSRAVGLVKVLDGYTIHNTAQFLAHTVAHLLGIDHDTNDCTCANQLPCLMNKQVGAIGSSFTWQFSKCSVARMHNILQNAHIQCILNRPFHSSQLHQCGNGVVDGDEECDCGRKDECSDPCCDPISCTLKAHAQCAAHHSCCNRCKLADAGQICRMARSICDVAETCDGISGDCPTDGYLVDGISCGLNGNCWKGNCSDSEQQCKQLWGDEAHAAEEACFDHNFKGVEYGNCGRDRNGQFVPCANENKRCGILHCKDGGNLPRFSNLTSFNFQFLADGKQIQCKSITNIGVGLVEDGTTCGSGRVCLEGTCLPLAQVSPPVHCPSNNLALSCSGHGDCTTTQNCLCYDGWTGIACDVRSNTSRRLVFPSNDKSGVNLIIPSIRMNKSWDDTSALLGIMLLVGIFLLLLLICLLFCYRRRTSSVFQRPVSQEKPDESFQDDTNRVIKFGPTPSWTKEKRNQKKNKHVYGALQRINEANEERDTLSVRSRESAAALSSNNIRHANSNGSAINAVLLERNHADELEAHSPFVSADGFYPDTAAGIFADNTVSIHRRMSPLLASPAHSDYATRRREASLLMERTGRVSASSNYEPDLLNGGPFPLYAASNTYNRTRVPPPVLAASPSGSTSSRTTANGRINGPLKLSSFHAMLKQIESDQLSNTAGSEQFETECLRLTSNGDISQHEPPPPSADSGNPGSQCGDGDLFTDNFKLVVPSS